MTTRKLSNWLDSYLQFTFESEPPEIFHIWTAISTVASVLERKCVLNYGSLSFYPNMYIVLVAPSGKVRKGTAMNFGLNLLYRSNIHLAAESITREALVRELKKSEEMVEIGDNLLIHSSLTICAPELVVFLGYNQQQLMMDLVDWYDCGKGPEGLWTYRAKTKGLSDEIIGLWVNLYGATTPELLRSTLSLDAIGGGLTSRIIFIYADKKRKSCPAPFVSPETAALGEDLYHDLELIHLLKGQFKPDSSFIDLWIEWYLEQEDKEIFKEQALQPYCSRRGTHVMKLTMILNACRTDSMILTASDLTNAIDLLTRTEKDMPKVFYGVGKSQHAEVLSKVMSTIGMAKEISKTELMNLFYHDADAREMEAILETLESMKFITRTKLKNKKDTIIKYCRKRVD